MDLVLFRISPNGSRLDYLNFMPRYIPISCGICDLFSSWHFAFSNKSVPFCWYSLVGLFCSFVSDGMWGLNLGVRFGSSFYLLPCCTFTVPPSNLILWDLIQLHCVKLQALVDFRGLYFERLLLKCIILLSFAWCPRMDASGVHK